MIMIMKRYLACCSFHATTNIANRLFRLLARIFRIALKDSRFKIYLSRIVLSSESKPYPRGCIFLHCFPSIQFFVDFRLPSSHAHTLCTLAHCI